MTNYTRPELLAPAGDFERLVSAVRFGADAVYLAGKEFGMRSSPNNFTNDELRKAVGYAHERNVKVYLTCNTVPRNDEMERLPAFLEEAQDMGIDAFIISDIGVMTLAKKYAPKVAIHISTQAGVANFVTANELYNMGASRVVLARELSFDEIAELRAKTPKELEIEAFVHGSMCVSFSGRCLLSNYMTGRDSNRGDCAQPCRWKYALMEEKRPGEYFPVFEDGGTHILNSKDMCMIEHLPKIVSSGITSLKIEGRAKSSYYVSVVTNAYRAALNGYFAAPGDDYKPESWILEELEKVSHREYSTGFYFGTEPGQVYENGGYVRDYAVMAFVEDYKDGWLYCTQRNKFYKGDTLDALPPGGKPVLITADEMENAGGEPIDSTPHPMMPLRIRCETPLPYGTLLRKQK